MGTAVVELLGELIAIPSVNPHLAPAGACAGEESLTQFLIDRCQQAGWLWTRQRVHPQRSNLLVHIPGGRGDVILWDVHQDTVSGEGMSVDPFVPRVRDGKMFGRGACDVKGAMAAMLVALQRASTEPAGRRPSICLSCTVNEECGFTGARALANLWQADAFSTESEDGFQIDEAGGLTRQALQTFRPRAAVVAEPTELNVVAAHRGVVRWQCTVEGRAAHSSRPEEGVNAIYGMAEIVRSIDRYYREHLRRQEPDPWCGPPTACVTTIKGGTGPNTIPDRSVIDIDRRLTTRESPERAYNELVDYLAGQPLGRDVRVRHDPPWMESYGLAAEANRPLAEQAAAVARSLGVPSEVVGVPYGTNAASIAAAGIPAVVFGPGSIAQAHTADEWIAVEQLELAEEAYYRIAGGAVDV